ncbi:unnamed protein product [marine sediment metagenome]|uniref:Uncharacterized protein n=1 Tax=marine sediment metagenome TaxID=412755 RepID=X0RVC1_9ZZZZ
MDGGTVSVEKQYNCNVCMERQPLAYLSGIQVRDRDINIVSACLSSWHICNRCVATIKGIDLEELDAPTGETLS